LKVVGFPGVPAVAVKAAVGAWSGVMAMAFGSVPTPIGMAVPVLLVATVMGITVPLVFSAT